MGYSVPHSHDAHSRITRHPNCRLHKVTDAIRASRNYPAHLLFFLARKETNSPSILPERLLSPEVGSEDLLHYYVVLLLLPAKSDHHHLTSCPPLRSASIKRWISHEPAGFPKLRGPRELTARSLTQCQRRPGNGRTLFAREEFDRISIVITARGSNRALIHALRRAIP